MTCQIIHLQAKNWLMGNSLQEKEDSQTNLSIAFLYGMAIRKNKGETSWCKWQADKASGTNNYRPLKNPLSSALVEVLKPVFEKLSSLQLLQGAKKC